MKRESQTSSRSEMGDSGSRLENGHWRNNSAVSGGDHAEQTPPIVQPSIRRHYYDFHCSDSDPSTRISISDPIPPPTLTVKSEFPTLSRSKAQQSVTCLVTLDVPEKKLQNYADDTPFVPSMSIIYDQKYQPPSPTERNQCSIDRTVQTLEHLHERGRNVEREEEHLAYITEELRQRVENWHGLDFNRLLPLFLIIEPVLIVPLDSGNFVFMVPSKWAKTVKHGRSLNVFSFPRCSYV